MAYRVPVFNVVCDLWYAGRFPNTDLPDIDDQECQFYVTSRGPFDVNISDQRLYSPPIYLRLPLAAIAIWVQAQIVECPPGTGRYFSARWKERMHLGFPNEYLVIVLGQCASDGTPILRDVEDVTPPPFDNFADADLFHSVELITTGTAERVAPIGPGDGTVDTSVGLYPSGTAEKV